MQLISLPIDDNNFVPPSYSIMDYLDKILDENSFGY